MYIVLDLNNRVLPFSQGWFVVQIWLSGSVEDYFKTLITYFYYYPPLKRFMALHLKKKIPLPKKALYQVWLKLAHWFWKRRYFKRLTMHFNNFFLLSPHGERRDPSLKDALCHVWRKLIQRFCSGEREI